MAIIAYCLLQLPCALQADADDSAAALVIAGSGSNLAITRSLAEAFTRRHPVIGIEIPPSIGSKGGIRAAADDSIDIGLTSRPLKAAEDKLGLTVRPYARTAVVFGVHPSVSEGEMAAEDLLEILRGQRLHWRNQQEIVVFVREPGDSSIGVLEQAVPGFKAVFDYAWKSRRWTALFTDQKMNQMLSKTPHAIGITDLGSITAGQWGIKVLKFNGILPSVDSIAKRAYPLTKALAFVYHSEQLRPGAQAFIDFVLSDHGSDILHRNGYAPVP